MQLPAGFPTKIGEFRSVSRRRRPGRLHIRLTFDRCVVKRACYFADVCRLFRNSAVPRDECLRHVR